MKFFKIILVAVIGISLTAATAHKFYVSVTKIEYVAKKESLQIITQIFVDDLEKLLSERYAQKVHLGTKKETEKDLALLKKYVLSKINLKVNGLPVTFTYIGQKYERDEVKLFLEVTGIPQLSSIEIENKVLMDAYPEQQNIIHVKTPTNRRSIVLELENPKGMLNFDSK